MADVGDRIVVASKGEPRSGVVTGLSGAMITVRWDTGRETSLIPGPGVLSVVTSRRRSPSALARPTSTTKAAARKTSASGSRSGVAKKAASKKAVAGRTPMAKKAAHGKKPVAKGTSSSRTTGKKTR